MRWYGWLGAAMIGIPLAALFVVLCIHAPWAIIIFLWAGVAFALITRAERY